VNEDQTTSRKTWRRRIVVTGVFFFLLFVWWFYLRSGVPTFPPWVTWSTGGEPHTIIFHVTRGGRPVSGVALDTESTSGITGEELTDESGSAVLRPGEGKVVSIYIDHRQILLRPVPPGGWFFLPSCHRGLTFHVAL
jgi:hypothetical protein